MITGVAIVKNESGRIVPTLESFAPYVDRFVICDTGSTDGTCDEVSAWFDSYETNNEDYTGNTTPWYGSKSSELLKFPFVNFSQARNKALTLADNGPGWLLMFDCDMRIEGGPSSISKLFDKFTGPEQAASLPCRLVNSQFDRRCLFRAGLGFDGPGTERGWHYEGAVHEVAVGPGEVLRLPSPVLSYDIRDHARREKRWREFDLPILDKDRATNPRSAFYYAQTLECLKEYEKAIDAYRHRLAMGGYYEDLFLCQCRIGDCQFLLGRREEAISSWLLAFGMLPYRAEPLEKISRELLSRGYLEAAWHFGQGAAELPFPEKDVLFVDQDLYRGRAKQYVQALEQMIRNKEQNA